MRMLKVVLSFIAMAMILVACGGGGGGGGASPCLPTSGNCGGTTSSSSSSSSGGTASYTVSLNATYSSNEMPTNVLKYETPVNLEATFKDGSGKAVVGARIDFLVSDTKIASVNRGGSVLSDANGRGMVTLSALTESSQGVVTITVNAIAADGQAQATANFQINAAKTNQGPPGLPVKLKYLNTTVSRLFVRGASAGNTNAVETTQVRFEVRDADDAIVPGAPVYFDVTKRNETTSSAPVLTCTPDFQGRCLGVANSGSQYMVQADTNGVATITVQSGGEPLSFNVMAALKAFVGQYDGATGTAEDANGAKVPVWISTDQIVVSSNIPNQNKFFVQWVSGATCLEASDRVYPCTFTVSVFDALGQPVANGTPVNVVTASGGVVMDTLAGQPAGTCLTKDSQCTGKYFGNSAVPLGYHIVVAYVNSKGGGAALNRTICDSGIGTPVCPPLSWQNLYLGSTLVYSKGSMPVTPVLTSPSSDVYLSATLRDAGPSYIQVP